MKHFNKQLYTFLFKLQRCHTKSHMQQTINNRFPDRNMVFCILPWNALDLTLMEYDNTTVIRICYWKKLKIVKITWHGDVTKSIMSKMKERTTLLKMMKVSIRENSWILDAQLSLELYNNQINLFVDTQDDKCWNWTWIEN